MRDLRTELERLGDRVRPTSDAFERLERTRRRKERNRRIAAGAVAFVVAVAGSLTAFTVFRDTEARVAGEGGAESFLAIWPESSYDDALAVQEAVDAGDQSLAWRFDADETALAFARDALGWTQAEIDPSVATFGDGTWVAVRQPPASCQGPQESGCRGPEASIELRRLDGSSGIWSVASARSDEFLEGPTVGSEIVVGSDIEIGTELSTNVYMAFVGLGPCAGWEQDVIVPADGSIVVTAPELPDEHLEGCDVGLIVLHAAEGSYQTSGLGRQLLEYGLRTDVYGMLAVPVRLVLPSGGPPAPDVARVACDGTSVTLDTGQVHAQPDGVHIDFVNQADEPLGFTLRFPDEASSPDDPVSGTPGPDGDIYDPGAVRTVGMWAPASYSIVCWNPSSGEIAAIAQLEVVDPAGHYVPTEIECTTGEAYGSAPGYVEGTLGDQGAPADVVRARLTGLQEGDVVELAGYPEATSESPAVRIVRDGVNVGSATLFGDGQGGWLLSSLEGCGGTNFGWFTGIVEDPIPPDPTGSAECGPPSTEVTIVASDQAFDPSCVTVPAGEPFAITLVNRDGDVPHNVSIYLPGSDEPLFVGSVCHSGRLTDEVPGLLAGTYELVDDVTPATARATLIVE